MAGKTKQRRIIDERTGTTGGGGVPLTGAAASPTAPVGAQPGPVLAVTIGSTYLVYSAQTAFAAADLSWRDPTSAPRPDKYQIQWAITSNFANPTTRGAGPGHTASTVDGLPVATLVYFRVRAVIRGVEGQWSATASTMMPDDLSAPAAPTSFAFAWDGLTGDLTITWTNPTSRNLRDVRVRLYTAVNGTLLLEDASTVGRFVLPFSRNRQLLGGQRTSLYVVLTSRSVRDVLSVTDLTGTATISAPATPTDIAHNWQSNADTAPGTWRITWNEVPGAAAYILTINGRRRLIADTEITYSSGAAGVLVSIMRPRTRVVTYYDYDIGTNTDEHGGTPSPTLIYSLAAQNIFAQGSASAGGTAVNAAPPATTMTALGVFSTVALRITPSPAQDLKFFTTSKLRELFTFQLTSPRFRGLEHQTSPVLTL
jgi:hypothetical protein